MAHGSSEDGAAPPVTLASLKGGLPTLDILAEALGSRHARCMSVPPFAIMSEPVPSPPPGWFEHRYAVLADGALALIRCNWDPKTSPVVTPQSAKLRLSILRDGAESEVAEVPGPRWPIVDRIADGRWLVVSARARPGDLNGRTYDPDGLPAGGYVLDDAIAQIACTPGGMTWVAYFDERNNESALIAFNIQGERAWALTAETYALDCYALSATGEEAWACTYPDFPIVRVAGLDATLWENEVDGARAIAAKGKHVILAGGYVGDRDRVALLTVGTRCAEVISEFRWPEIDDRAAFVGGRDGILHAVVDGRWMRLSISAWLASLD